MNATQKLHDMGQRLWLDNITRGLLSDGTLARYIRDFSVTGLTSNPSIFEQAIRNGDAYGDEIRYLKHAGKSGESLFLALALTDLTAAADLFRPMHDATRGADGWVSVEVSPLLADDTAGTVRAALQLHVAAARPNLFVKIPGTPAGIPAIEEAIFLGVPVNVTLLFSADQYLDAAGAYLRGIARRIDLGLSPNVASVASVFVSRWDTAVRDKVPAAWRNRLGIAMAQHCYKTHCTLLASSAWQTLNAVGARPQRLLWASTGSKDSAAADTLYVDALAAVDTINTMPEKTLLAFAAHGAVAGVMSPDGGDAESVLAGFSAQGIDLAALATELQEQGTAAFALSWQALLDRIEDVA